MRFYEARFVPLAGVQGKFQVRDTWGCDPCWKEFKRDMLVRELVSIAEVQ